MSFIYTIDNHQQIALGVLHRTIPLQKVDWSCCRIWHVNLVKYIELWNLFGHRGIDASRYLIRPQRCFAGPDTKEASIAQSSFRDDHHGSEEKSGLACRRSYKTSLNLWRVVIHWFLSLISTQCLFLCHGSIDSGTFLYATIPTSRFFGMERSWCRLFVNMWVGWGHGREVQSLHSWLVLTPHSYGCHRSHLSRRTSCGVGLKIFKPLCRSNRCDEWNLKITHQKTVIYQYSGFVSIPKEESRWWNDGVAFCVLVRWTLTKLPFGSFWECAESSF